MSTVCTNLFFIILLFVYCIAAYNDKMTEPKVDE